VAPLDAPWRSLAVNPGNNLMAAHPNSPRVFRGYSPVCRGYTEGQPG
jgi:hypothetical protein